jgi:hypothetical protein
MTLYSLQEDGTWNKVKVNSDTLEVVQVLTSESERINGYDD